MIKAKNSSKILEISPKNLKISRKMGAQVYRQVGSAKNFRYKWGLVQGSGIGGRGWYTPPGRKKI